MPRPNRPRPNCRSAGLLCGAAALGAAGLSGCGATGANLAASPDAANPATPAAPWYSPARLAAAFDPARAVGLADDDLLPATRGDLKNPAALDLAYANLRTASGPGGAEAAEEAYRRVLADDPANVEALIGLARLIQSNAGDRPNELAEAETAYREAVAAAPADARPHTALGRFLAEQNRWGDSAAAFGKAVAVAGNTRQRREAYFGLAVATAKGGNVAASRPHFVAAVGEAGAHFNVGTLMLRAGDRVAAEAEFRRAVAKDRGDNPEMRKAHAALAALTAGRDAATIAAAPAAVPAAVTPAAAVAPPAAARPATTAAYAAPPAATAAAPVAPQPIVPQTFIPAPATPAASPAAAESDVPPAWPFPTGN